MTDGQGTSSRPRRWRLRWCTVSTHRGRADGTSTFTFEMKTTEQADTADDPELLDLEYDPLGAVPARSLAGASIRTTRTTSAATRVEPEPEPEPEGYLSDPYGDLMSERSEIVRHIAVYDVTDVDAALADLTRQLDAEGWASRPAPGAARAWSWLDDDRHGIVATPQDDGATLKVVTGGPS